MHISKRILAGFLIAALLLSQPVTVWANPTGNTMTSGSKMIRNSHIAFMVSAEGEDAGRFTIGNEEGNPNYSADNNQSLLYGHPDYYTSYTTVQVNDTTYIFTADETWYDEAALMSVATMTVEGVVITQTLQIVKNDSSGIADTVKIHYAAENHSGAPKNVGIRILLDTMLGSEDDAPFKVPSLGEVSKECELTGNQIPQYWQHFDNLENPSIFAVGTFYKTGDRKPDKVQFVNWSNVYPTYRAWHYTVNPNSSIIGDSAVSAYWNPIPVTADSPLSVSTYYGVSFFSEDDAITATQVKNDGFAVQIVDENGAPLSGAAVTALSQTVVSDKNGLAFFSALPDNTNDLQTVTLNVAKTGYHTVTAERHVTNGSLTSVTLYKNDGNAHIVSAKATISGQSTDLLSSYRYFAENVDGTKAAPQDANVAWLTMDVETLAGSNIRQYRLVQGGKIKVESSAPTLQIPVYTGTAADPNQFGNDWRIDKLKADQDVYLQILDSNGNIADQKLLGMQITKPSVYRVRDTDGTLDFGSSLQIAVPSYIPILGDSRISLGWNELPFRFSVAEDGSVKFAIHPQTDSLTGEVNWNETKEAFDNKQLQAVGNRLYGENTFGTGDLRLETHILGYGEGYIDENDQITIDVGLVITVTQEAGYPQTFFLGTAPVQVSVGETVTASGQGQLTITGTQGGLSVTAANGNIQTQIDMNLADGISSNGMLDVDVNGHAALSWLYQFDEDQHQVDLTGDMYISARTFLFQMEKQLTKDSWTIYQGSGNRTPASAATVADLYRSDAYSLIGRNYLTSAPFGNGETVKAGVYPGASPVLVKAGNVFYLFWLDDVTTREASNRTALVYAVSTDLESWSAPVQIFEETADSTADFNFDVCVDGKTIHLALCKANTQFTTETVTLDTMAAASEIYYAALDTETGNVTTQRLTNNRYADIMPQIIVHNGNAVVAYVQNQMKHGFFGNENTHKVVYTVVGTDQTRVIHTDSLISQMALGTLNGEPTVACVLDTDWDFSTQKDTALWIWNSSTEACLSKSGAGSVLFAALEGTDVLMWYENNNLYYTDGTGSPLPVFDRLPNNFNRDFSVIGNQMVWVAREDSRSAVYALSYKNGSWTAPYKLFHIEGQQILTLNGYSENEKTYLTYLKADDLHIPSLRVSTVTPEPDLSLQAYSFDAGAATPNQTLPITVTVKNTGSKDVDTLSVTVKDAKNKTYTQTFTNAELVPGATKTFVLDSFTVPNWLTGPQNFTLSVTCDQDRNLADNTCNFTMGYADLALETTNLLVNGEDSLNIIVKNRSAIRTDATLRIMADSADGAVLYEKRLTALSKETHSSILVNINQIAGGLPIDRYYVCVTADTDEQQLSDNTQLVYLARLHEQRYALQVSCGSGGSVTGDIGGSFPAGAKLTVTANENPLYRFVGWISNCGIVFSDAAAPTATFTMPDGDVIINALFENISAQLQLSNTELILRKGYAHQLHYTVNADENISDTLVWTSGNPEIATVDATGKITAVGVGATEIRVSSTNDRILPAACWVQVTDHYTDDFTQLQTPHPYADDTDQIWVYSIPCASSITLTFDPQCQFEPEHDWLQIMNPDGTFVQTFGSEIAGQSITVTGNHVFLHFHSDYTNTGWGFRVTGAEGHDYHHKTDGIGGSCSICYTGWTTENDQWYYCIKGVMQTGWIHPDSNWYYLNESGVMVTGWQQIDGKTYYMNSSGARVTGEITIDGIIYIFSDNGALQGKKQGWYQADGNRFYYDNGILQTGWLQDGSAWYYLNAFGAASTGWETINGIWYFFESDGAMATGWKDINGSRYYFAANGAMVTGWRSYNNAWYYLKASGAMATGWQSIGGNWYYFDASGAMVTGWQKAGTAWYYLNTSGEMVTGLQTIDGKAHRFNSSGVWQGEVTNSWISESGNWCYYQNGSKVTGWKSIGGVYYYFDDSGIMQTGWLKSGNTWYYLKASGAMATGWTQASGKWYYFAGSGAMVTGWQKIGGTWYYFQSGGAMQTGWLKLGSSWYYFQSSGAMATGSVKIGNKTYRFNSSGVCLNP